jgi:hypothetical protein
MMPTTRKEMMADLYVPLFDGDGDWAKGVKRPQTPLDQIWASGCPGSP